MPPKTVAPRTVIFCLLAMISAVAARADITFVPGDYYSTDREGASALTITQYDPTGQVVGTLTLSSTLGNDLRGIAFGPDNLLYVTVNRGSSGFAVLALDSAGSVQQTYTGSGYVAGNIFWGKLAFDNEYLYVAAGPIVRFLPSDPNSGTTISAGVDIKPLPNGNLIVADEYDVKEITTSGVVIRNIFLIAGNDRFYLICGIAYDPFTNSLFVTHLGYTNFSFQLMRLDATSGALEKNVSFTYGNDIFLDLAGDLIVGSRSLAPTFFGHDLEQMGSLAGNQQLFVTRYLPWPTIDNLPTGEITAEATGPDGAVVSFSPTSTDLEGNPNMVNNQPEAGSTFPIGTTQVTTTAIDRQSHTASARFNVMVQDTTAPAITVPSGITAEAMEPSGATVNFAAPTWTDAVDGNGTASADHLSGSVFPIGTTTVTCSHTDAHGNIGTKSFDVTVQDTTPPVLALPVSITVGKQKTAKGQPQGAVVNFSNQISATDLVDGIIEAAATPASGSFFPLGDTVVMVTGEDTRGNKSTGSFIVTVSSKAPKAKSATISVSASPSTINENQDATFMVTATSANPSQPVIVNFQMSGTATPASQYYTLSQGRFVIPSGGSSATVVLHAVANTAAKQQR